VEIFKSATAKGSPKQLAPGLPLGLNPALVPRQKYYLLWCWNHYWTVCNAA